jgi:hypothetical protein
MADDVKINQWLKDTYGNMLDSDVPKYRVVWSSNLTEKRFIKDRAVYSGPIFLRHETGVFGRPSSEPGGLESTTRGITRSTA